MKNTNLTKKGMAAGFAVLALVLTVILGIQNMALAAAKTSQQTPSVSGALTFLRNQIKTSGLVDSYVEDNTDYSYTYDDALAAMAFISSGDTASAKTILDAFLKIGPVSGGGFLHRYHATDGTSADGILRVGHNTYLLQAMNKYYLITKDTRYNALAKGIADYILSQQASDGGIYGAAGITWKSTENNLGALSAVYNFGVSQNLSFYVDKANAIKNFIITSCWNGTRFLEGQNDTTIVTDVQGLGGMILGPAYSGGAYWIKGYTLNTKTYKAGKTITGFDENTDKDTVWTEGTLQESMAFMVAGDVNNFSFYKNEAQKLYQSSGALLEASNKGTTGGGDYFYPWQGVAPTAWYVFAGNQDNVLAMIQ